MPPPNRLRRAARRRRDLQSALHPCRGRARQDASPASLAWAGNATGRTQGPNHRREIHVWLRRRPERAKCDTFKEELRAIDLLVIDDLQFLQGKATQEEFGQTLNALIDPAARSSSPPTGRLRSGKARRARAIAARRRTLGRDSSLGKELRLKILKAKVADGEAA